MTLFGSKDRFAILVGPYVGSLRTVEVWAGGKSLTPHDTSVYLPSFVHALVSTKSRVEKPLNFLRHEPLFLDLGVEEAFERIASAESPQLEQAWSELRVIDWGPTTDDFLCFLLPIQGKLQLVCREQASGSIHAVAVPPYEITQAIEGARDALSSLPPAPNPSN